MKRFNSSIHFILVVTVLVLLVSTTSWSKENGPADLIVTEYRFLHEASLQNNEWQLEVQFNRPVDFSRLYHFIILEQDDVQSVISFRRGASPGKSQNSNENEVDRCIISPSIQRTGEVMNRIIVQSGLSDATKTAVLKKEWTLAFKSADTFTIESLEPSIENRTIHITFSEPVDGSLIRNHAQFNPPVSIRWYNLDQVTDHEIIIHGSFVSGTTYMISFDNAFRSKNGRLYSRTVNTVLMPDLDPSLTYIGEGSIIERDSRQLINLQTVNINEILYEGIRVPPVMIPLAHSMASLQGSKPAGKPDAAAAGSSLEKLLEELSSTSKQWSERLSVFPEYRPFLGTVEFERHLFFQVEKRNEQTSVSLPMTFRKDKHKGAAILANFVNNRGDGRSDIRLFRFTDMGITVKRAGTNAVIWVTSLRTGEPLSNVSIMGMSGELTAFYLGKTDRDGLLWVDQTRLYPAVSLNNDSGAAEKLDSLPLADLSTLIAVSSDDVSYLSMGTSGFLALQGIDHRLMKDAAATVRRGVIFTERGIYRPGEKVFYKAVIRENDQGTLRVPEQQQWWILVNDAKDQLFSSQELKASEFGTLSGEIALRAYDPLGTWTVTVQSVTSDEVLAKRTFEVQEFRAPRHFTDISFDREQRISREYVNVSRDEELLRITIAGKYYAGGPVKHGLVRWKTILTGTVFEREDYPDFTFGYPGDPRDDILESGDAMLDEKGEVTVTLPLTASILDGMYGVKVTASVVDFDGRAAAQSEVFQVKPSILVGFARHPGEIDASDPQQLPIMVIDQNGKLRKRGNITVEAFQKGWSYVRKRNTYGEMFWEQHQVWRKSFSQLLPVRDGKAVLECEFGWGGDYLIKATYRDGDQTSVSGTVYQVRGDYYWFDEEESSRQYERLNILPDKNTYEIGETMGISFNTRSHLGSLLITVERDIILSARVLRGTDAAIQLPVPENGAPNVYLSGIGMIPRGEFPLYREQFDLEKPAFVFGTVPVDIRSKKYRMNLWFNDGGEFQKALPGSEMTINLTSQDEQGRALETEIALCVVDERVLALTGYTTPLLDTLLYYRMPLAVWTWEARTALQEQTPFDTVSVLPLTGGGGAAAAKDISAQIRKNFNPVAYFNPRIYTDTQGKALVSFILPDTMTTYRVFAVACDRGARFASIQKPLTVVKDFYLETGFPRFFRNGDVFDAHISVFNKTDTSGQVSLEVTSSETLSFPEKIPATPLGGYDRVLLPLHGEAKATGDATIELTARFGDQRDIVQEKFPVLSTQVTTTEYRSATFTGTDSISFGLPFSVDRIPWSSLGKGDCSVRLTVSGSPFLRLEGTLRYLLNYPYGCIEQTSSGVIPLAALRNFIRDGFINSITLQETDKFIVAGVERIFTMQTDNGGFSYWPGSYTPDPWGSLYAMSALVNAEESGADVNATRLEEGLDYLKQRLTSNEKHDDTYKTMALYILARKKHLQQPILEKVLDTIDPKNREAMLTALLVAHEMKAIPQQELVASLEAVLGEKSLVKTVGRFHPLYRGQAIALMAASKIMPDSDTTRKLAGNLLAGMNPQGFWTSTSDSGWSLLSLGTYFAGSRFIDTSGKLTLAFADGRTESAQLPARGHHTFSLDPRGFLEKPDITISVEPNMTLIYELAVTYPRIDYQEKGHSNGFVIEKKIKPTDGDETINVGDIVEVAITVSVPRGSDYQYLAMVDPLPAGLVAINSKLKTEEAPDDQVADEEGYWWNYWDNDGFYRFIPNHVEFHDDHVAVFKNYCWGGEFRYSYYARAVCAGSFAVPATKIELMYQPDIAAYTARGVLTIVPQ